MPEKGKLIAIEGLEGAGKSTAISTVTQYLTDKQIKVQVTREPGGTEIGEKLREILKNPDHKNDLDARVELLLMYASRIQLANQLILPCLNQGTWVVADRFELSSYAYQGEGRGLDIDFIEHLSTFSLNGLMPDLTLFLDISPDVGMERAKKRGAYDRFEQEDMSFFHRVYKGYLNGLNRKNQISARIDASQSLRDVQNAILNELERHFFHE